MRYLTVLFALFLIEASCTGPSERADARHYGEALGDLISDPVPLRLDMSDENLVSLNPDSLSDPWIEDKRLSAYEVIEKGFVIGDRDRLNLNLMERDNTSSSTIATGRKGKGPMEFESIKMISRGGEYLYVYDDKLARVTITDHELNYIDSRPMHWSGMNPVLAATDQYLITHIVGDKDYLLAAYSHYPDLKEMKKFLPRLLPPGIQPMAINNVVLSADSAGSVYVAFQGLPYIINYDKDLNHEQTFELSGPDIEEFFTVPSEYQPGSTSGNNVFVRILMSGLVSGKSKMYIEVRGRIHEFDIVNAEQLRSVNFRDSEGYMISVENLKMTGGNLCGTGDYSYSLMCFPLELRELKYNYITRMEDQ